MAATCPICDIEMTQPHYCLDYDFSNFSIELELLDLPFSLEPYGSYVEQLVSPVETDPVFTPTAPKRLERSGQTEQPQRSYSAISLSCNLLFLKL